MELTVLGCSGSHGSAVAGACSGYLVRHGDTTLWLDCGNGSFVNLQRHLDPAVLTGVVITHLHPDHCVDLYGLHVLLRYGIGRDHVPVLAPPEAADRLGVLASFEETFDWTVLADGDGATMGDLALRFSRTDHPIPTYAVEVGAGGRRIVYTSDTGPRWDLPGFASGADLLLAEATYEHADRRSPIHLSGRQAGEMAAAAGVARLVLTHLWPGVDPGVIHREGSEAFGLPATLAEIDQVFDV